ncbi:hypothetical protein HRbin02_01544 [Candidatus Calditenuaceae archaeon HR02]|nr:hypothetical protein HRbin02_01544 [Candidatus Calditenuaceae archaeon HR02]
MLPVACDVERLLLHDKYLRIFAVEILTLFPLLATALYIYTGNQFLAAPLLLPAIITLPMWLRLEARRRKRVMKIFQVENIRDIVLPLSCVSEAYYTPAVGVKFTIVDAVHESRTVRYVDYEERRKGERVILILDGCGRVLASASVDRPPSIDTISKLS